MANKFGTDNESSRDQWIQNKLQEIPNGKSILDVGAGEQRYRDFCSHLNYTSQDIAQYTGGGRWSRASNWKVGC